MEMFKEHHQFYSLADLSRALQYLRGRLKIKFLIKKQILFTTQYSGIGLPKCSNEADARDVGSDPGLGRSPGGGHGNPLQYACLENPMDRGAWRPVVYEVLVKTHHLIRSPSS